MTLGELEPGEFFKLKEQVQGGTYNHEFKKIKDLPPYHAWNEIIGTHLYKNCEILTPWGITSQWDAETEIVIKGTQLQLF